MDFTKKRKTEENGDTTNSPPPPQPDTTTTPTTTTPLSPEDIRKILQPFSHDQLLNLLQSACLNHHDTLSSALSLADQDSTLRKLFVRGVSPDTTSDTLRSVFSDFGNLDEAIVIFDKNTGKSKGYGFVTFSHVHSAILALKNPSKKIDGRITVTQLAAAGGPAAAANSDVASRKVFVGNVPFDVSSESLLDHFMTYGEIEEGPLGFDKGSGKTRGFAFFVYKSEEGARACLVEPMKNIDGHQVFCKLAVDNKKNKPGGVTSNHSYDSSSMGVQVQQQHQQQQGSFNAPMLISQYGGYGGGAAAAGNGYGMQSSVPSYGNPVPAAAGGGYGYGNSQFGGDYSARVPPNSAGMASGGYPDGSHYGTALPSQPPQPVPVPRPAAPGGMYQGVPPYY